MGKARNQKLNWIEWQLPGNSVATNLRWSQKLNGIYLTHNKLWFWQMFTSCGFKVSVRVFGKFSEHFCTAAGDFFHDFLEILIIVCLELEVCLVEEVRGI